MKQCTFKALLTLDAPRQGRPEFSYPSEVRGLMVAAERAGHPGEHEYFPAVITTDDDEPLLPGGVTGHVVTIRVKGEEPADFFAAGREFSLWSSGGQIGHGVVSRRVFFPAAS